VEFTLWKQRLPEFAGDARALRPRRAMNQKLDLHN
jgi:hypothetical protein